MMEQHITRVSEAREAKTHMQIGIDSFAAAFDENSRAVNPADRLRQLVEQIEHADEVGLDTYLIPAARALGLDCGSMSGFDHAKVDEEFFAAGKPCFGCDQEFFPEGHVKTNFLCNLGYGDPSALHPRLPRLAFNEACSLL